jgi:hypothetical protein
VRSAGRSSGRRAARLTTLLCSTTKPTVPRFDSRRGAAADLTRSWCRRSGAKVERKAVADRSTMPSLLRAANPSFVTMATCSCRRKEREMVLALRSGHHRQLRPVPARRAPPSPTGPGGRRDRGRCRTAPPWWTGRRRKRRRQTDGGPEGRAERVVWLVLSARRCNINTTPETRR